MFLSQEPWWSEARKRYPHPPPVSPPTPHPDSQSRSLVFLKETPGAPAGTSNQEPFTASKINSARISTNHKAQPLLQQAWQSHRVCVFLAESIFPMAISGNVVLQIFWLALIYRTALEYFCNSVFRKYMQSWFIILKCCFHFCSSKAHFRSLHQMHSWCDLDTQTLGFSSFYSSYFICYPQPVFSISGTAISDLSYHWKMPWVKSSLPAMPGTPGKSHPMSLSLDFRSWIPHQQHPPCRHRAINSCSAQPTPLQTEPLGREGKARKLR